MKKIIFVLLSILPLLLLANKRFYIYKDGIEFGVPSGYFGSASGKSIKMIEHFDSNPQDGKYSMMVRMNGSETYGGFFILATGHWKNQGADVNHFAPLKGYTEFSFYARSDERTTLTTGFGEAGEDAISTTITVTNAWKRFSFYVGDVDLAALNGVFFVSIQQACNVQFDEIYFERKTLETNSSENSPIIEMIPVKVEINKLGNNEYQLLRGGAPYYVNGAGFQKNMYQAKAAGANSVRIWGHEIAKSTLDSAHKHGMTVMLGLWLQHERHGFNYDDEEAVNYQILKFKEAVNTYKDHPALLMWGIGNEVDLFYTNKKVWNTVQEIAKYIHEVDPNHPTSTVTAGLDTTEIPLIQSMCPDIDIFGVNSYADVHLLPSWFRKGGLTRPYVVTEWGPTGNWECPRTKFGIGIEETSGEKAERYRDRFKSIKADSAMCIGSYSFFWGNKQETTPTWFGIFMPDGKTESEAADELQKCWSDSYPSNRAPHLSSIAINTKTSFDNIVLEPGKISTCSVVISEPENESLSVEWEIMPESTKAGTGGDWEEAPEAMPELIVEQTNSQLKFKAPEVPGAYRIFYYAKDPNGNGAYGNVIFQVE